MRRYGTTRKKVDKSGYPKILVKAANLQLKE